MKKLKWAKPDSMKKLRRDSLFRDYARKHPNLTLREIGEIFGISKQRVSVILKRGK